LGEEETEIVRNSTSTQKHAKTSARDHIIMWLSYEDDVPLKQSKREKESV
jgi:hypothetical protein